VRSHGDDSPGFKDVETVVMGTIVSDRDGASLRGSRVDRRWRVVGDGSWVQ
jgi:hypothetical protein